MNLNNDDRINSSIIKTINFKAMIMGILLLAATFLVFSNTYSTAFAQSNNNNIVGCAHTVKVTISHLPKQTADVFTQVTLSNIGPSDDRGEANITIPGIGSGHVTAKFHIASFKDYGASVSDIPGQTGESTPISIPEGYVCSSGIPQSTSLSIPGIGSGSLTMTKVN